MPDTRQRQQPVLVIGKSHRPGRISFGPEVVVQGVSAALGEIAPALAVHVEPRDIRMLLRLLLRRSTRIVHFLSTGRWSLLAPLIRLVLRKHIITTFHGYAPLSTITGFRARLHQRVSIGQARAGLAGSQTIVSVSALLAERTGKVAPHAMSRVIPNGLSSDFVQALSEGNDGRKGDARPLRLLIVGFGRHKGVEGVLEALESLDPGPEGDPAWTLTLVGVTPMTRDYLRDLRSRFGRWFDRITVMEAIPHERMPGIYRGHDVLLLWSSHESFGLVVLEALACGLIPVVSDRVGAKELIQSGVNGFVVPFGDTAALAGTIGRLQHDYAGIDRGVLRVTAAEASMARTARAYANLYRELLGPGPTVCFVTNICPHYRVRAFELLGKVVSTRFLFFSDPGRQRFWEQANPVRLGLFDGRYVRGTVIPWIRIRLIPDLYRSLWHDRYDVLVKCINGKFPLALSFAIARLRGKRFILWTGLWHHPSTPLHRLGRPVVRFLYRNADAVVVYGSHVRDYLCSEGVAPARIVLAPQAIDNEEFARPVTEMELRSAANALAAGPGNVILFVGRLEDHKGVPVLIRACTQLEEKGWTLALIGDGEKRSAYERLVSSLGLRSVRFLGHVENQRLPAFYRLATVLVLPSVTTTEFREPWGLVTNEAFNQGCPVVVTETVGAAAGGLVRDGVNGLVIREDSSEALASALSRILRDPGLRTRLGEAGRTSVAGWTQERMVGGFLEAIGRW